MHAPGQNSFITAAVELDATAATMSRGVQRVLGRMIEMTLCQLFVERLTGTVIPHEPGRPRGQSGQREADQGAAAARPVGQ